MDSGLTSTMDFGFAVEPLQRAVSHLARGAIRKLGRDSETARLIGVGSVQLEALRAWMRLGGLVERSRDGVVLTALGWSIHRHDPTLVDPATWWVLHWQLSMNYAVWSILRALPPGYQEIADIDQALQETAPEASQRTIKNARQALVRALRDTPVGRELGLVELQYEGERVCGIKKLPVRHGQVPMAAVAYAVLDWARREEMTSATLQVLTAPGGPGPVLHMSAGTLERYFMDIHGAFHGRVLSYSRTAELNEAYFKAAVTPLQVLVSHYLHARDGISWTEALDRAQEEVAHADATDA